MRAKVRPKPRPTTATWRDIFRCSYRVRACRGRLAAALFLIHITTGWPPATRPAAWNGSQIAHERWLHDFTGTGVNGAREGPRMKLKLSVDRLNYLNIGLMLLALTLALARPFELFLLAYAVLGPLHYLTEISWLHDKGYYTRRRHDYLFLL